MPLSLSLFPAVVVPHSLFPIPDSLSGYTCRVPKVKIGIVGSRFQADCIAAAVKATPDEAEVVAVASPTPGNAQAFAERHGIARAYGDYRELLRDRDVEMISISAPNYLHAQITIDAAKAGKHVACEKPLCMTLEAA